MEKKRFMIQPLCILLIVAVLTMATTLMIPRALAWTFWKYDTGGDVASVGVSMDGSYIVAGTKYEKDVHLIDNNGSLLWKKSLDEWIECVSISGSGGYIVASVWEYTADEPDTFLFNKDGDEIWAKDLTQGRPLHVEISSDSNYIAAGDNEKFTYLFNNTGNQLWTHELGDDISSVSISSEGEYVAAGSWDECVYLFNTTGHLLWSYNINSTVYAVSVSPDGEYVAAGGSYENVFFFDRNGNLIWTSEFQATVKGISVSENGGYTAVARRYDEKITLLNATGKVVWEWEADDYVNDVAISSDGRYVAAGSDDDHVYFLENLPPTSITCGRSEWQIFLGESIAISGEIDPPHEEVDVTLTYTRPNATNVTRIVATSANGSYVDTFTPDVEGMWRVEASWAGDANHMGDVSSSVKFLVSVIKEITIKIEYNQTFFSCFEPPDISYPFIGSINYTESIDSPAVVNFTTQEVVTTYDPLSRRVDSINITYAVKVLEEAIETSYDVKAIYDFYYVPLFGTPSFLFSYELNLKLKAVIKYETAISLSVFPQKIDLGETISVSGSITPEGGPPVVSENVTLVYTRPDDFNVTRTALTDFAGAFDDVYQPDMAGSWKAMALWGGDEDHRGSESAMVSFIVLTDLTHEVTWEDVTYRVRTVTNSTVSNFAFNQSAKQISFNVTGPSGKIGFCNVTIPKVLLGAESLEAWTVILDDDTPPLSLIITENTHTFVFLTYGHSTRKVTITGTTVIPEFPPSILLSLFILATLLAIVLREITRAHTHFACY